MKGLGSVGLIIGATISQWLQESGIEPGDFTGPILSPGYGWQGAECSDLKNVFHGTNGNVLVTVSRAISQSGPDMDALIESTQTIAADVRKALREAIDGTSTAPRGHMANPKGLRTWEEQ